MALAHLHSNNIFHRDIKLDNILIGRNSKGEIKIKLIDFGFSIWMDHIYKDKLYCGTNIYMAPELLLKRPYLPGPTDIWALGVIIYVLVCVKFPFKA